MFATQPRAGRGGAQCLARLVLPLLVPLLVPLVIGVPAAASAGASPAPKDARHADTARSDETLPPGVAARGPDVEVSIAALDALLLDRHGMSTEGRALLELLLKSEVLEALASEAGLNVPDADVSRRWSELDRQARQAGSPQGLLSELEQRGFSVPEFREFLRMALVQERLARRALGLGEGAAVGADAQELWLQQQLAQRGLERPLPPWADGVVARCGDVTITTDGFAAFLRRRLPVEDLRAAAGHLLLLAAVEARLPELSAEDRASALERELERRRLEHERSVPGMSFEQRLGASGRSLEQLRRDPSVAVAALTRLWVDREYGEPGLRRAFEAERDLFEGLYGRAAEAHVLVLGAGPQAGESQRSVAEAEALMANMVQRCGDVGDFRALVGGFSEDPSTRESGGELGFVTRSRRDVPTPLREAIFADLEQGGAIPAGGRAVGPVRLSAGLALLWVSAERPSPEWPIMGEHVHRELRRRFVERILPSDAVQLWR